MARQKPCPVCDATLDTWRFVAEWGVEEEGARCTSCGYLENYSYGAYQASVGDQDWQWSYVTPLEEVKRIEGEIDAAIQAAKAELERGSA